MQFTTSIILAAIAFATAGKASEAGSYSLGADLPNGLYAIPHDATGTLTDIAPIWNGTDAAESSNTPTGNSVPRRHLTPRQLPSPTIYCHNYDINEHDLNGARGQLAQWCNAGNFAPSNTDMVFRQNNVLYALCNWGGRNPCGVNEINDAELHMNGRCGRNRAAKAEIQSWKKAYARGTDSRIICRG